MIESIIGFTADHMVEITISLLFTVAISFSIIRIRKKMINRQTIISGNNSVNVQGENVRIKLRK